MKFVSKFRFFNDESTISDGRFKECECFSSAYYSDFK